MWRYLFASMLNLISIRGRIRLTDLLKNEVAQEYRLVFLSGRVTLVNANDELFYEIVGETNLKNLCLETKEPGPITDDQKSCRICAWQVALPLNCIA